MRMRWLGNVAAYTVAGAIASGLVGGTLATLGMLFLPPDGALPAMVVALTVATAALARELGLPLPLPQPRRQTRDTWAKFPGGPAAGVLWGLDLGLVFTTWFTFSGVWLLVVLATLAQRPALGATLFVAYWVGRALSVWVAPLLAQDARALPQLLAELADDYRLVQVVHVAGLVWAIGVVIVMIGRGLATAT